jgi:acetolactate synthase I/II/III large subunit
MSKQGGEPIVPEGYEYGMHGGRVVGRILKEHGTKYVFGIYGGHVWALDTGFHEFGIKRLHMRHEQAGVYAADAYAKCTRQPGICYATAGCGAANMIGGISQAYLSRSPVIALVGHHNRAQDVMHPLQEGFAIEWTKTITKWGKLIPSGADIPLYLRKALRDCMSPPPGPICLAMDPVTLMIPSSRWEGDIPIQKKPMPIPPAGDPDAIEKAVDLLLKAERPAIAAGDGVYWSHASSELKELVELLQIPVNCRRLSRGTIPEDHPLSIKSSWRVRFWKDTDVLLVLGVLMSDIEAFGRPPVWPDKAKWILVDESPTEAWFPRPTEMEIMGSPKLVLRQMIDCAKSKIKTPPKRAAWLQHMANVRESFNAGKVESVEEVRNDVPIHPFILCHEIANFLDDDATIVLDSFTGSNQLVEKVMAKFPGQVLDGGENAAVGQGIGMGIGAQLARPGKQVFVMMGDGGMGIGGMDIETAARYNLPVVYMVYNDSEWMSGMWQYFKGQMDPTRMLPDIRYDKMFEYMGAHGEFVTESKQIRPALERAFNSGKTSVINVIVDNRVIHSMFSSHSGIHMAVLPNLDRTKLPEEMHDLVQYGTTDEVVEKLRKKGWPLLKAKGRTLSGDAGSAGK